MIVREFNAKTVVVDQVLDKRDVQSAAGPKVEIDPIPWNGNG